ncbi:flagellar basal-body rod protein FlgG [bacterium BMS3Abin04]|nr:flagellar basal-body rod protein FlgG [bacterium BMS3Abin04]
MVKGLYYAAKSLHEKIRNIQIVANNLANINTTGFKREIPFSEYMERANKKSLMQITDFTEGALIKTDNPFNLAISGKGFFAVQTNRGIELTKNGKFKINNDGFLVTEDGNKVLGRNGEISFLDNLFKKGNQVTISSNVEVKVGKNVVNQLMIVKPDDQSNLIRTEGQKYYSLDEVYNPANEKDFKVMQGYLEESNTNPIVEMQAMIQLEKDFEASQKMVTSLDNMMSKAKEIGKV